MSEWVQCACLWGEFPSEQSPLLSHKGDNTVYIGGCFPRHVRRPPVTGSKGGLWSCFSAYKPPKGWPLLESGCWMRSIFILILQGSFMFLFIKNRLLVFSPQTFIHLFPLILHCLPIPLFIQIHAFYKSFIKCLKQDRSRLNTLFAGYSPPRGLFSVRNFHSVLEEL